MFEISPSTQTSGYRRSTSPRISLTSLLTGQMRLAAAFGSSNEKSSCPGVESWRTISNECNCWSEAGGLETARPVIACRRLLISSLDELTNLGRNPAQRYRFGDTDAAAGKPQLQFPGQFCSALQAEGAQCTSKLMRRALGGSPKCRVQLARRGSRNRQFEHVHALADIGQELCPHRIENIRDGVFLFHWNDSCRALSSSPAPPQSALRGSWDRMAWSARH